MKNKKATNGKKYVLEFWDFGAWNEMQCGPTGEGWDYKQEAIDECNRLNKETKHIIRETAFDGHRFRIRERP